MDQFVARANIDHFLDLLRNNDLPAERISSINKLLIEEEEKLDQSLDHLEFAESRAASYRRQLEALFHWRDGFPDGSSERVQAEGIVTKFEVTLELVEGFCQRLRYQVNRRSL